MYICYEWEASCLSFMCAYICMCTYWFCMAVKVVWVMCLNANLTGIAIINMKIIIHIHDQRCRRCRLYRCRCCRAHLSNYVLYVSISSSPGGWFHTRIHLHWTFIMIIIYWSIQSSICTHTHTFMSDFFLFLLCVSKLWLNGFYASFLLIIWLTILWETRKKKSSEFWRRNLPAATSKNIYPLFMPLCNLMFLFLFTDSNIQQ